MPPPPNFGLSAFSLTTQRVMSVSPTYVGCSQRA